MNSRSLSIAIASLLLGTSALSTGCGDGGESSTGTTTTTTTTTSTTSTGTGGTGGTGTGTGGQNTGPEVVVTFDPAKGQFVEGLDIKNGTAYVGAVLSGEVVTVDLAKKEIAHFGSMPAFTQMTGALVGLTLGADGAVYG